MKLHANWGHASAQQLKRALVDSDENNMHLLTCADEVLEEFEVRRAFDKAPYVPIAGAPRGFHVSREIAGDPVDFGLRHRLAYDGCIPQEFPSDTRAFEEFR